MFLIESVLLAVEGLFANKMRALLTMLGIIIGIASVIGIATVGSAMTSSVNANMESLGATNIIVNVRARSGGQSSAMMMGGGGGTVPESDAITDDMIEALEDRFASDILAVSLSASAGSGRAQDGRLYSNVSVSGVNDGYAFANNVPMLSGRFIREGDVKARRSVAVVSDLTAKYMFPDGRDPLGQEIKVTSGTKLQTYVIVGVYKYESGALAMFGASSASEKDIRTSIYIPVTTAKALSSADSGYSSFTVTASSNVDSPTFARDIRRFLNTYYVNNPRYEIASSSMESMLSTATTIMGTLNLAISVIAGISLLVGGIGVMNIMLVSVTERTREIGTRKALGARSSAVRSQFIVEAVIICGIGGLIGIALGMLMGYGGSSLLGFPAFPSISTIGIAVLFSMLIGVFFGYYPANKAAKLDPIEALRYE